MAYHTSHGSSFYRVFTGDDFTLVKTAASLARQPSSRPARHVVTSPRDTARRLRLLRVDTFEIDVD